MTLLSCVLLQGSFVLSAQKKDWISLLALNLWPTFARDHVVQNLADSCMPSAELLNCQRTHASQAFYYLHWTLTNWFFLLMHKPNGFPFLILFFRDSTQNCTHTFSAVSYTCCQGLYFSQFQIKLLESASWIFISSLFIIDALSLSAEPRLDVRRWFWE